ncbi:MAG: hypothetical protein A3I05_06190 [Deltaproteobacteria bacterium RIFCSPLOWO2_02_FULL_44_10]|nr:MAG: hypothetical protein A3C46_09580 [Deltaproteobacteria bacterium RIFCSPHIGHO2_02_FULL_44_16]OGQ45137.1 MAG: hypothetical protein A3I05_06190 [Deltaproteobacteria bacterium RIFCSPLOWO2_02_FULL_44_10]
MKTILCYGDSNTYGCKPLSSEMLKKFIPGNLRFSKDQRWSGILAQKFENKCDVIEEGLNARTTVWDDPMNPFRNGKEYLVPCLESHAPVDIVILMLGTNDFKTRFSLSAYDVSLGIASLIEIIKSSGAGPNGTSPKILLISPAAITHLTDFADMFGATAQARSKELSSRLQRVAANHACDFLDAGQIVTTSEIDGFHLDADSHTKLGEAVFKVITQML